jgi:lysophospholipase L1-like esterase
MYYAAIGDSFTEGVGDELPDGSLRGWADLVAAGLAAGGHTVHYANFAVRGRLLEPVITEQLTAALALTPKPTLMTLNGGGNDMMRRHTDGDRLIGLTEAAVRRCAEVGVELVLLSGADPSARLPFGSVLRRRGEQLTAALRELAERHAVRFVDVFHDREIHRPGYWSPDRLHLAAPGHQRVAGLVLTALGHDPADAPTELPPDQARRLRSELRYYREHVVPWVSRHARGRSSGDGRSGKYLDWVPVEGGPQVQ